MSRTVQPSPQTLQMARGLRTELARGQLSPAMARLYSHFTLLRAGQPGLPSWREAEADAHLADAMRLLDAAEIERAVEGTEWRERDSWRDSARRAAELLEWLSLPQLNPRGEPIRLLSAAVYQLAGYPARSSSLLRDEESEPLESRLLRFLLNADFPRLLEQLVVYWGQAFGTGELGEAALPWSDREALDTHLWQRVVRETAGALGVLCAEMRWGREERLGKAIDKLAAVGDVMLHGEQSSSWMLARLCSEVVAVYGQSALRRSVEPLAEGMSETGKQAIERYLRRCYLQQKSLAWPSQVRGIERMREGTSFALCTPTGSGKTTVAELAILRSLFPDDVSRAKRPDTSASLVLYLVPSRALAAEVEAKLAAVLRHLQDPPITITGLYGGTDWGPTDAWLTALNQTVLICTYEKAEALIRFQGPLFLKRVSLAIIDEAHAVQFDGNHQALRADESRALRLEALVARLLTYLDQRRGRVVALSAVAAGMQDALASWVTGTSGAKAAQTLYRSTRQLIGRLLCRPGRAYRIEYDLLDGADLHFEQGPGDVGAEKPYIARPFPACPPAAAWDRGGAEKRLRPYFLWAAMHLAAQYAASLQGAVLMSIPQHIDWYMKDFLTLLETVWADERVPAFFLTPQDAGKADLWQRCLRACADYFGESSYEYRLLRRGIAVHHGSMPGLMARLLVEVVQERIVHCVLATSTLSEGINLPIETILLLSVLRGSQSISVREFGNLVGRAGRPGIGVEGRTLVLLQDPPQADSQLARSRYFELVRQLQTQGAAVERVSNASSPLAALLVELFRQWSIMADSQDENRFFAWLETCAPLELQVTGNDDTQLPATEALDMLDRFLLAVITEAEQLDGEELSAATLEEKLRALWQRSYAHYASNQEATLEQLFLRRGRALRERIYPERSRRRRLYRASLPPRAGTQLLARYPRIKQHLLTGEDYALWTDEQRFAYIRDLVTLLAEIAPFAPQHAAEADWSDLLRWWLAPRSPQARRPRLPEHISTWYHAVDISFRYKLAWALGSIIALVGDEVYGDRLLEPSLENWPILGLPWIVFWLKELLVWGTLDPVAASLLAWGRTDTRQSAEAEAKRYYLEQESVPVPDEMLNAARIRSWAETTAALKQGAEAKGHPSALYVELARDFSVAPDRPWRVLPVPTGDRLHWFDPAGFLLAACALPEQWEDRFLHDYDFTLNVAERLVVPRAYAS